jgi:Ni,Fe-hydrogenase III component G
METLTREQVLDLIGRRFSGEIVEAFDKSPKRVYFEIKPDAIVPVARCLFLELGARFNIATAVDARTHIEILYHFTLESINLLVSLRVKLDRSAPSIESLAPSFEAANWIEREMHELLGIEFRGHPDMRRLLLPEQWPESVYPLRQDYKEWDENAIRDRGV